MNSRTPETDALLESWKSNERYANSCLLRIAQLTPFAGRLEKQRDEALARVKELEDAIQTERISRDNYAATAHAWEETAEKNAARIHELEAALEKSACECHGPIVCERCEALTRELVSINSVLDNAFIPTEYNSQKPMPTFQRVAVLGWRLEQSQPPPPPGKILSVVQDKQSVINDPGVPVPPSPFQVPGPEHVCCNQRCRVRPTHIMSEHPLCIYRRDHTEPEIFEAHGLEWYRHTPGDPQPCGGDFRVRVLLREYDVCEWGSREASYFDWTLGLTHRRTESPSDIIGWRPADAPAKLTKEEGV